MSELGLNDLPRTRRRSLWDLGKAHHWTQNHHNPLIPVSRGHPLSQCCFSTDVASNLWMKWNKPTFLAATDIRVSRANSLPNVIMGLEPNIFKMVLSCETFLLKWRNVLGFRKVKNADSHRAYIGWSEWRKNGYHCSTKDLSIFPSLTDTQGITHTHTHKGEVDMCKSEKLSSCGAASHSSDKMGSNSERVGMMAPNGWMRGSGARIGLGSSAQDAHSVFRWRSSMQLLVWNDKTTRMTIKP